MIKIVLLIIIDTALLRGSKYVYEGLKLYVARGVRCKVRMGQIQNVNIKIYLYNPIFFKKTFQQICFCRINYELYYSCSTNNIGKLRFRKIIFYKTFIIHFSCE